MKTGGFFLFWFINIHNKIHLFLKIFQNDIYLKNESVLTFFRNTESQVQFWRCANGCIPVHRQQWPCYWNQVQCFKYTFVSHQDLWVWILEITGLVYIYLTHSSYKNNYFYLCEGGRFVCKETAHVSTKISLLSKPRSVNVLQGRKSGT